MRPLDHGIPIDISRRCSERTSKGRQCKNPPLEGIDTCFLHTPATKDSRVAAWHENHDRRLSAYAKANAEMYADELADAAGQGSRRASKSIPRKGS